MNKFLLCMRSSAFAALALLITGCGSLKVQVDILNPGYVKEQQDLAYVNNWLERILKHASTSKTADARLEREWKGLLQDSPATALKDEVVKKSGALCTNLLEKVAKPNAQALHTTLTALENDPARIKDPSQRTPADIQTLAHLLRLQYQYWKKLDQSADDCYAELKKQEPKTLAGPAEAPLQRPRDEMVMPEESLRSSPVAYVVASAPSNKWKEHFNSANGTGFLGATDIAIKLTPEGQFTVKGLTFDPSETAKLITKVSTQVLANYALNASFPLGSLSKAAPTAASTNDADKSAANAYAVGAQINSLEADNAKLKRRMADQLAAALRIASATVKAREGVNDASDATAIEAAAKSALSTFKANETRLSPAK